MSRYRKSSHAVYQIHIHFVFITKYRKPVLKGEVGYRLRELLREICRGRDIEISKGHIRPGHVHLLLSLPPQISVSKTMHILKGKTSYKLLREYRQLRKEFWGRHLWGAVILLIRVAM